jgi:thermitase
MHDLTGNGPVSIWHRAALFRRRVAFPPQSTVRAAVLHTLVAGWAILATAPSPLLAADEYVEEQVLVKLNPGRTIEEVNGRWGTTTIDEFPEGNLYLLDATGLGDVEILAEQMELDPAILDAEANYFEDTPEGIRQMVVIAIGGDWVDYEDQEITERIGLDLAHQRSRGVGVTIGLIDSGVDPAHEALFGHLSRDGYDFVDEDEFPWEESNGVDDDEDGITDEGYGHGTMVAGILALVAPGATILPIRVLDDEGRATAFQIAKAMRYAVDHGADVLNCSFGVPQDIDVIDDEIDYAVDRNVAVIAGGGNENRHEPVYFPAKDSKTMMVVALDSMDVKADFSDYNSKVLVSAPGTGVRSAFPGGEWGLGSGCSFAVPFVTGEAALILSRAPHLDPDDLEDRIEDAVDHIDHIPGNEPWDGDLGSGRIYLPDAVDNFPTVSVEPGEVATRLQAHPNPASGSIRFTLPSGLDWEESVASIDVFIVDAVGRRIATPVLERGELVWNGRDSSGESVSPGVYFAHLSHAGKEYSTSVRIIR